MHDMDIQDLITKSVLQVRKECAFFGALMLFAKIIPSTEIDTAATNGRTIFINEQFLNSLNSSEQNALLLHEVLHMALLHCLRIGSRDPMIWNIAADIVVNNLIQLNTPFQLPKNAIVDKKFENESVEEIYETLLKNKKKIKLAMPDIIKLDKGGSDLEDKESKDGSENEISAEEVESYWKDAIQVVENTVSNDPNGSGQGSLPLGLGHEIKNILEPEVDWRHALWKYVGKTNSDFDDLDRRFIYKGLYLEALLTEGLEIFVCIDTSGSVSNKLLSQFAGELKGILSAYPHVKCILYYCDTSLDGPYEIDHIDKLPPAKGRGGTSFQPFFKALSKSDEGFSEINRAAIYFTDGYGDFPVKQPDNPTMWLVPSDGLKSQQFPFGEVIRISTEN